METSCICIYNWLSYLNSPICKSLIPAPHIFLTLEKYYQVIKNVDNLYLGPDQLNSTNSTCISNLLGKYILKGFFLIWLSRLNNNM